MKHNLQRRKDIRLRKYDYSKEGYYFITICTKNRECILSKIINIPVCTPELTIEGNVVNSRIKEIENIYSNVTIDEYIIMPNHIHMILTINKKDKNSISKIIQQLKGAISKEIGYSIWQKLFYEHIIRNEKEYWKIREYIINNPVNWDNDKYF